MGIQPSETKRKTRGKENRIRERGIKTKKRKRTHTTTRTTNKQTTN